MSALARVTIVKDGEVFSETTVDIDGDWCRPKKNAVKIASAISEAFASTMGEEYDYFDYWEEIPDDEKVAWSGEG